MGSLPNMWVRSEAPYRTHSNWKPNSPGILPDPSDFFFEHRLVYSPNVLGVDRYTRSHVFVMLLSNKQFV